MHEKFNEYKEMDEMGLEKASHVSRGTGSSLHPGACKAENEPHQVRLQMPSFETWEHINMLEE